MTFTFPHFQVFSIFVSFFFSISFAFLVKTIQDTLRRRISYKEESVSLAGALHLTHLIGEKKQEFAR